MLVGLSDLLGRRGVGVLLVAMLAVPWGIHNARLLIHRAELQADRERLLQEQIVASGTLFDPDEVIRTRPDPVYTLDLHLHELEELLPEFGDLVQPSREAVLRAALALQFSVEEEPGFSFSPPLTDLRAFDAELFSRPDGCVEVRPSGEKPRVAIPQGSAGSVALVVERPFEVEALISGSGIRPDYSGLLALEPARPLFLNMAIDESITGPAEIILRSPARLGICPVDAVGP
jgi:hypothetical protein